MERAEDQTDDHSREPQRQTLAQIGEEIAAEGEIAERLVIGRETVKTHVRNVLDKLGARDRTHAVSVAYERHLLRPAGSRTRPPAGAA